MQVSVAEKRVKYYIRRIKKLIEEEKKALKPNMVLIIRARPVDFWCSDLGYHFDAMIYLGPNNRAKIFGTGFHCSWAKAIEVEDWEAAIAWLAKWMAERPGYRWSLTADTDFAYLYFPDF